MCSNGSFVRPSSSRRSALLLALAVTAQARCSPPEAVPPASTLTVAVRGDVTGFFPNPPMVNEAFTIEVNRSLFEGLVRFDERLRLAPGLAVRWENPDDRTYVFELRPGLRFSDGTSLTANDVAASLEATTRRRWPTRDYLQAIEKARAIGERRVEIRTRFPYLALLTRLPWGFVVPEQAVDQTPVPARGTGPYRLESWTPGTGFVLTRNPHHRGPPAAFDRVRFVVVFDDAARMAAVERGYADAADHVPLDAVERLHRRSDLRVLFRSGLRVIFLCLRVDRRPFSDPRVREAIDLALNRSEVVQRVFQGRTQPAPQLVPPAVVGYNPSLQGPLPDRERARQLLAEAGYPRGFPIRLDGPSNRYVKDREVLQEVARQLDELGLRVEVNAQDKRVFFPLIESGESLFHLLGFACESGDAGDILNSLFHSPTASGLGAFNSTGLVDPELDHLIEHSDRSDTDVQRTQRLQVALARVTRMRVALPLLVQTEGVVLSRRIAWDPPLNLALRPDQMRPAPRDPS